MSDESVANFKVAHQSIVDSIDRIQPLTRTYIAAKPLIREFREKLLAHLSKQDNEFFEELNAFYHEDKRSMKMVEFLDHDLKETKIKFLIFFEKYTGEMADRGSRDFPRDFIQFSRDVLAHIKVEEEYLFSLLERRPSLPPE